MAAAVRFVRAAHVPSLAPAAVGAQAPFARGQRRARSTVEVAATKAGPGGRSSVSGLTATVFGATGFVGRYIVNRLGQAGTQVMVPYRGCELNTRHLRVMGDLGQIIFAEYNLLDKDAVRKLVHYSDVVINLTGQDNDTRNYKLEQVHVEGARNIAEACSDAGVRRLIHFSALNAHPESRSKFYRTKAQGEQAVREAFPQATIVRPADVYGMEDRFLNKFAMETNLPLGVPLVNDGSQEKMPVFVSDVASGVMNLIRRPETAGQTYEFVGGDIYTVKELVQLVFDTIRKPYRAVPVPQQILEFAVRPAELLPLGYSRDLVIRMGQSDACTYQVPTLESLGVDPVRLERNIVTILRRFRSHAHHDEYLEE